jgi:hypothetical protein
MLMKSDKISSQFLIALGYLEKAEASLHAIREIECAQHDEISVEFTKLTEFVEDIHMEVCAPMQMAEEETLDRITKMEEELFNLRASLR